MVRNKDWHIIRYGTVYELGDVFGCNETNGNVWYLII